jgi:inorganic pyrophosphatase
MKDQKFSTFRPHPWHGLLPGPKPPQLVTMYVEITPFDLVKYEVDKATGYLRVDRPQRTSSQPPVLYGFVPQTYCGDRVGALAGPGRKGDGDPLDICVFSERPVARAEVLLTAKVVGGLRMVDHGEADDKIVAVLENDNVWGAAEDIADLPPILIERLRHYFTTYKLVPGEAPSVTIEAVYGRETACQVVLASIEDYKESFGS